MAGSHDSPKDPCASAQAGQDPFEPAQDAENGLGKGLTNYGDKGFSLFLRKAFIKGAGYTDDALSRPVIGIVNTNSSYNPCHGNAPQLVEAVKRGVMLAGGLPVVGNIMALVDALTPTARIAGACNAVLLRDDGTLLGDQFDGAGFVRGIQRKGCQLQGASVLVSGCGGVGSAIAASLAGAGVARLGLFDARDASAQALAARLQAHYPQLQVGTGSNDPAGYQLVVNATPLGMNEADPLPFDVSRIDPQAWVGEVVMKTEYTPLLRAALERGCQVQVGTDMLFEMIPAYLEFFGFGTATAEELRAVARIAY